MPPRLMADASSFQFEGEDEPAYVDTPYGLMTAAGRWYHISEEEVRSYAGDVLDHVSLDQLVQWADAWVDSPRTVALWVLPVFLWGLPVSWAVGGTLLVYVGWALASPALPSLVAVRAVSGLRHALVQGLYYVTVLSAFAAMGQFAAVTAGLVAFVLFRWGIVEWALRVVLRPLQRALYPLPVTDQVLRGLIVRAALAYRVSVPQVDALTREIIENWGPGDDESVDRDA